MKLDVLVCFQRLGSRLSDQREKLIGCNLPLPVYSAIHVKKEQTATEFNGKNTIEKQFEKF